MYIKGGAFDNCSVSIVGTGKIEISGGSFEGLSVENGTLENVIAESYLPRTEDAWLGDLTKAEITDSFTVTLDTHTHDYTQNVYGKDLEKHWSLCAACSAKNPDGVAENHSFANPTRVDDHTHKLSCVCGEEKTESHTLGEWTVTKEATATEKGSKTKACACGHTVTEELPVLGSDTDNSDTPNNSNTPVEPDSSDENNGLSGGVIACIVIGIVAVLGVGGFVIYWFVFKKKRFKHE